MVRIELTADDSLAAIRARSRFGMAIAAMIRMIATTINNSISEKPFCFRISFFSSSLVFLVLKFGHLDRPTDLLLALFMPIPQRPPDPVANEHQVACFESGST